MRKPPSWLSSGNQLRQSVDGLRNAVAMSRLSGHSTEMLTRVLEEDIPQTFILLAPYFPNWRKKVRRLNHNGSLVTLSFQWKDFFLFSMDLYLLSILRSTGAFNIKPPEEAGYRTLFGEDIEHCNVLAQMMDVMIIIHDSLQERIDE